MSAPSPTVERVVVLGASNLTRCLHVVLATAREAWGPGVEVVAAPGLGRSYGLKSRVLVRALPGILDSGLWAQLERLPPRPTRAVVTDVGNDILYGASVAQILAWVDECVTRLERVTTDVVITGLPLARLRRLSRATFVGCRSIIAPQCRLSLAAVLDRAEGVVQGLEQLAARRGARFVPLRSEWYSVDPIHIRPRAWRAAWREILTGATAEAAPAPASWGEALRLLLLWPERQWLLGHPYLTPQPGRVFARGGRLWLY